MDLLRTIHRIQRAIGFDTSFKEKSQRNHTMCAMRVVKLSCSRVEVIVNEVQTASESLGARIFSSVSIPSFVYTQYYQTGQR